MLTFVQCLPSIESGWLFYLSCSTCKFMHNQLHLSKVKRVAANNISSSTPTNYLSLIQNSTIQLKRGFRERLVYCQREEKYYMVVGVFRAKIDGEKALFYRKLKFGRGWDLVNVNIKLH